VGEISVNILKSCVSPLGHEPRVETRPGSQTRFNPGLPNVGLAIAAIPLGLSALLSALDLQLRQGAGERSIDGSDFFVGELIMETGFGPLAGFFDFGLIDLV
jgi:hypothetical protein